jgi:hypothetical protein
MNIGEALFFVNAKAADAGIISTYSRLKDLRIGKRLNLLTTTGEKVEVGMSSPEKSCRIL